MTKSRSVLGQETTTTNPLLEHSESEDGSLIQPWINQIGWPVRSAAIESCSIDDLAVLKAKLHQALRILDGELARRVMIRLHPDDSKVSKPSARQRLSEVIEGTF